MPDDPVQTTVLIIRHAERDTSNPVDADPHLTPAGKARAQTLVHVAGLAGLRAIYTSHFIRTQETARPLATQLGLTPVKLDDAAQLRADILAKHAGEIVLVVGHSDTGPALINLLGGGNTFSIAEKEFDRLFVVNAISPGLARVTALRYGAPS